MFTSVSVKWGISGCQAPFSARQVSQVSLCFFLTLTHSNTNAQYSASSFTAASARYVPSLCVNESLADLRRKKTHTHAHAEAQAFSRGDEQRRGRRRGGLSSHAPVLLLLSFGSIHSSVLSFLSCSMCCHCLSLTAATLLLFPLSLRSILFLPHRIRFLSF